MATDTVASDKGIGLGVLFGLLAVAGAVLTLVVPSQEVTVAGISVASWGFGVAMVAAVFSVGVVQVLWE